MNTFGEYVITPGRPASRSPASRTRAATARSRSSSSPRAQSRASASVASRDAPRSARTIARRTSADVGDTLRPYLADSRNWTGVHASAHEPLELSDRCGGVLGDRRDVEAGDAGLL